MSLHLSIYLIIMMIIIIIVIVIIILIIIIIIIIIRKIYMERKKMKVNPGKDERERQ